MCHLFNFLRIARDKIRTYSVQKVCGGVWQGFDHLTKFNSSKGDVLKGGLRGTRRFGTFLHKGSVLVQYLTRVLFWYMAGGSFWCMN